MDEETLKKIDHFIEVYKKYVEQLEARIEELEAANGALNDQLEELKKELENAKNDNPFNDSILEKIREAQKMLPPPIQYPPYQPAPAPNPWYPSTNPPTWITTSGNNADITFKNSAMSAYNDMKSFISGVENG